MTYWSRHDRLSCQVSARHPSATNSVDNYLKYQDYF